MSSTCHEEGLVSGVTPGNYVRVTVQRGEACGSCEAKGACHALGSQTKDLVVVVENRLGAQEGDTVRITMEESAVVKASAVLYLVPAVGLIVGAAVGYWLAGKLGWDMNGVSVVGCFSGLGVGLGVSWLLGKKMARARTFLPRLTAITVRAPAPGELKEQPEELVEDSESPH